MKFLTQTGSPIFPRPRTILISCILFLLSAPGILMAQTYDDGFVPSSNGADLYYEKVGNGPRTVIMPGRLFSFEALRWLGDSGYTFIAYDMRNRGRSESIREGERLTLQADVADLERVRRHFGVEKFTPVGYSYLGLMVILYALEHEEQVERIIQFGPVPMRFGTEYPPDQTATLEIPPDVLKDLRGRREENQHVTDPQGYCIQEWDQVSRVRLAGDPANLEKIPSGEFICSMPNEWPIHLARHMQHHFVGSVQNFEPPRDRIRELDIPVLTIHGKLDRNAVYGAGVEWVNTLPDARLLTIERGAHSTFSEFPELIRKALEVFLAGGWPEQADANP